MQISRTIGDKLGVPCMSLIKVIDMINNITDNVQPDLHNKQIIWIGGIW